MSDLTIQERMQAAANEISMTCKKYDISLGIQMIDALAKPAEAVVEKKEIKPQGDKKNGN